VANRGENLPFSAKTWQEMAEKTGFQKKYFRNSSGPGLLCQDESELEMLMVQSQFPSKPSAKDWSRKLMADG